MKPEEINLAVAECLGWYQNDDPTQKGVWWHKKHSWKLSHYFCFYNDLNTCAEFEKTLKGSKGEEYSEVSGYVESLSIVCGDRMEPLNVYDIDLIRATAPQRCEAFLRLKGKWKE